jgi:DNA-binding transcriptional ArsR family regulator
MRPVDISSRPTEAADRSPVVKNSVAEDRVFAAMSSRVRRKILDLLREKPLTTGQIAAQFKTLSRFAVMQHLSVLAKAKLVVARREGRERYNYLNVVPLHQALTRWVQPEEHGWAEILGLVKKDAEGMQNEK